MNEKTDFPDLVSQTREIWDANARWWNANMGEGNTWHAHLIAPAMERLLAIEAGETVLDLACGNGQFARRLACLGAQVTACDFSSEFVDCARAHNADDSERIEYRLMDLTDEQQLADLEPDQFDAAVCNMALMDMACITPLLHAIPRILRPCGRFVFSIPHPCFNTNGTTLLSERDDYDRAAGTLSFSVRVKRYRGLLPQRAIGIPGQPQPHFYFHRPLQTLLGACFAAGLVMDRLEEPAFHEPRKDFSVRWQNCPEIPPILVVRVRVPGSRAPAARL